MARTNDQIDTIIDAHETTLSRIASPTGGYIVPDIDAVPDVRSLDGSSSPDDVRSAVITFLRDQINKGSITGDIG